MVVQNVIDTFHERMQNKVAYWTLCWHCITLDFQLFSFQFAFMRQFQVSV
eukprot:02391.XXX_70331_70480_1 [CDS] Oithona nana genome sequencing.